MRVGEIKYKGQDCHANYITADFESFYDLRLARKHANKFCSDKTIYYVIYDADGNVLKRIKKE